MKLKYDRVQLRRAAKWIAKHNPHATHKFNCIGASQYGIIDEVASHILSTAVRHAVAVMNGAPTGSISTGGYWVFISDEDEHTLYADILVDPAVGKDSDITDMEL